MHGVVKVGSYVESLDGSLHAKDSGLPPNKTMPPINEDASEIFGEPAAYDTTTKSTAVDGAAVAIPMEAVEENSELKKDAIKSAPLWVKLHHVPIVAYSEIGLSLITTQLGKPIMLDSYTSNICLSSWGRNTYARALVEFSA
ncbi:zinc knuckle CX2CX4HX4C containing protein, partial [Tanacetum coccineum]